MTQAAVETPDKRAACETGGNHTYWSGVLRRLGQDPVSVVCGVVLMIMLASILLAPWIAPNDPYQGSILVRLKPVGFKGHLLGTDEQGRDMLSRLVYGGRLSWFLGLVPVLLALIIGGFLGLLAGFRGGVFNMAIMRTTDVFYAFPSVLLAVAISGALGTGIGNAILSLTVVFTPQIVRVTESATASIRALDFVESARATGAGPLTIIRVHVLPNIVAPIMVYASSLLSVSMIFASGLSFLGLCTQPPAAEWGLMLNTLRSAIYVQPLIATLPGICIFVTSLCFNLLSDGLAHAMELDRG